jgi:hypothetical protein
MSYCKIFSTFNHEEYMGGRCPACKEIINHPATLNTPSTTSINTLQQLSANYIAPRTQIRDLITTAKTNGQPIRRSNAAIAQDIRFEVKFAHAEPADSVHYPFRSSREGFIYCLKPNDVFTHTDLVNLFRKTSLEYNVAGFTTLSQPEGPGRWVLTSNHISTKSPSPVFWSLWSGSLTISQIIGKQNYSTASNKQSNTFVVTVLWYPDNLEQCIDDDALEEPISELQRSLPTRPLPTKPQPTAATEPPAATEPQAALLKEQINSQKALLLEAFEDQSLPTLKDILKREGPVKKERAVTPPSSPGFEMYDQRPPHWPLHSPPKKGHKRDASITFSPPRRPTKIKHEYTSPGPISTFKEEGKASKITTTAKQATEDEGIRRSERIRKPKKL